MTARPLRLCAVATSSPSVEILGALRDLAGERIEHVLHLGGREADYKASSLLRMTSAKGQRGHVMDGDRFTGAAAGWSQGPGYEASLLEAMDVLQRGSAGHAYRSHALKHPSDYWDYVNIIADRLAGLLMEERIETVVFFDIPHLFYDILLYRIARHLGLRTLILRVGFDPAKFYSMERIEDFGRVRPTAEPARPVPVARGADAPLYYMKGIGQEPGKRGRLSARALAHLTAHVVMQEPGLLLRPAELSRTIGRMRAAARALPDWRDPFARFFHTDHLAYAETIAEVEEAPIDLDRRFVYFPLQMQPEMTTAILGGRYRDQLLAIEQLAAILPADVKILVKENPKQNGAYRSPMVFHRLRRIPAVELLPSHANTHALTAAAEVVATISGTAAWEAVTSGTPALHFGLSWMVGMPGVHRFRPGMSYDEITARPIDHAAIEAAYGQLQSVAHDGVVTRWALRHQPEVDAEENARRVAATLLSLLERETDLTFITPDEAVP